MWNEHFGIGVVEMMAAGLLVVAHNSGGPKADIVTVGGDDNHVTGFLASTDAEFADAIYNALTMSPDRANRIRANSRRAALRFSDEAFSKFFEEAILEARII